MQEGKGYRNGRNPSIAPRRILGEKKNSTRIKNMTEMYDNIPAPDYMKQLAKSH